MSIRDNTKTTNTTVNEIQQQQQPEQQSPEQPRTDALLSDGSIRTVSMPSATWVRVPTPTPPEQFADVQALLKEDDQFILSEDDLAMVQEVEVSNGLNAGVWEF
jgi:hypothetical protein